MEPIVTDLMHYRCEDCDFEFNSKDDAIDSCPNCSSSLIDGLAFLACGYLLGDWLGWWGDDEQALK